VRYRIRGFEVRSENAAKSHHQISHGLATWLSRNVRGGAVLDYGCGRLRYVQYLARRAEVVGLVDSDVQFDRPFSVGRRLTTVRLEAKRRWPFCRVYSIQDFLVRGPTERYDFILCANVLSAIPSRRVRSDSLRAIHRSLVPGGQVLVVNQHTNSYFTNIRKRPGAIRLLDGWLLPSGGESQLFRHFEKEEG